MKKGFTLIELSIVLIIISLVVAGVTGGKELIKQAEVQSQIKQLNELKVAYNTFALKFSAVPGDLSDATKYWTGASNGNGDGRLSQDADYAYDLSRENLDFFHHLSLAELTNKRFDGTWQLNIGYPELKIRKGTGMVAGGSLQNAAGAPFLQLSVAEATEDRTIALYLNVSQPTFSTSAYNDAQGIMSPDVIQSLDRKLDDGLAGGGLFRGYRAYVSLQGDCLDGIDGDYLLVETRTSCMGYYIL